MTIEGRRERQSVDLGYSWFEIIGCGWDASLRWLFLFNYLASIRSNSSKISFRYSLSTRGNSFIIDVLHQLIRFSSLQANPDLEIHPYREECKGEYTFYWFLLLVVYKGLLIFYGSFLSWTTRHVTIPALNDSRYIGLSVYIVLICSILGSLVALIPSEQIQLSYFLISLFILICTTATVCLVFVPKVRVF